VAGTAPTRSRRHVPQFSLNSDGRRHPFLNVLTLVTLVAGLVSFALGFVVRNISSPGAGLTITTTVLGLVSLVIGLYAQMVSATREERVLIVTGIIAGFVGLALGLSHGGFTA
jgi:FtsH-binding integral membrane protein